MKVALVHDFLLQYGGAERVLEVLAEMFPEAPIFTLCFDKNVFPDSWGSKEIKALCPILPGIRKYPQLYAPYLVAKMASLDFSPYDLVISSDAIFAKMIVRPTQTKHICYQYSPANMLYHFLPRKESRGTLQLLLTGWQKSFLRRHDYLSAQFPDRYITLSQYVGTRIEKYYHRFADVIYPPVDLPPVESASSSGGDYYLLVSRLVPNKNIDLAVRCCSRYKRRLIVVGRGDELEALRALAGESVEFVTDADDTRRNELYAHCKALLICNEEDFGITPVESMGYGHGVIAYRKGGAVETILEAKTGVFFDHLIEENLYDAMQRYDGLDIKPEVCRQQAELFSRSRFVSQFLNVIDELYR